MTTDCDGYFEDFEALLGEVIQELESLPRHLTDQTPPTSVLSMPQILRRGTMLTLFNSTEGIAKNEIRSTFRLLNDSQLLSTEVSEKTCKKVSTLLYRSITANQFEKSDRKRLYTIADFSRPLEDFLRKDILYFSTKGVLTGSNISWENISESYGVAQKAISDSAKTRPYTRPLKLSRIIQDLLPDNCISPIPPKLELEQMALRKAQEDDNIARLLWSELIAKRHRSAHDPSYSPSIDELTEYTRNLKVVAELIHIAFAYLRFSIEPKSKSFTIPTQCSEFKCIEIRYA